MKKGHISHAVQPVFHALAGPVTHLVLAFHHTGKVYFYAAGGEPEVVPAAGHVDRVGAGNDGFGGGTTVIDAAPAEFTAFDDGNLHPCIRQSGHNRSRRLSGANPYHIKLLHCIPVLVVSL